MPPMSYFHSSLFRSGILFPLYYDCLVLSSVSKYFARWYFAFWDFELYRTKQAANDQKFWQAFLRMKPKLPQNEQHTMTSLVEIA